MSNKLLFNGYAVSNWGDGVERVEIMHDTVSGFVNVWASGDLRDDFGNEVDDFISEYEPEIWPTLEDYRNRVGSVDVRTIWPVQQED